MTSVYQMMLAAGVPVDHHATDLYVPDTAEARAVLDAYNSAHHPGVLYTKFRNEVTGTTWLDIPFMYDPEWDKISAAILKAEG